MPKPTNSSPSAPLLIRWPLSSSADLAGVCPPVGVLVQQVNRTLVRVVAGHDGQRQRSPRLGLQQCVAKGGWGRWLSGRWGCAASSSSGRGQVLPILAIQLTPRARMLFTYSSRKHMPLALSTGSAT